jgi:hypothetical protein
MDTKTVLLMLATALAATSLQAATVTLPNTFTNGTVADADAVNANFAALENVVNANAAATEVEYATRTLTGGANSTTFNNVELGVPHRLTVYHNRGTGPGDQTRTRLTQCEYNGGAGVVRVYHNDDAGRSYDTRHIPPQAKPAPSVVEIVLSIPVALTPGSDDFGAGYSHFAKVCRCRRCRALGSLDIRGGVFDSMNVVAVRR